MSENFNKQDVELKKEPISLTDGIVTASTQEQPMSTNTENVDAGHSCPDWIANISKVNAPFHVLTARNPTSYRGYDGKQFGYCPWCGSPLTFPAPLVTGLTVIDETDLAEG